MKSLQKKMSAYRLPQIFKAKGVYPFYHPLESGQDTVVRMHGKDILLFGSNSYLGLTLHPKVIEAAKQALNKYGTGASGSRLMNGNLDLHETLETKLAAFVGKESATVFSTGFQANLGSISCLLGRHDYLLLDEKDHASIIEGSRLAYAKTFKYAHRDMAALEQRLKASQGTDEAIRLIVTDGVFSMEGDVAPLDKITALADKYNASVMVDDAHGLGVMGKGGRGTANAFGVTDKTDIIMGTFSKSLASLGGFVAADADTINVIKHQGRALLFSASMPPASVASTIAALDILEQEPERVEQLWDNTRYAVELLHDKGFSTSPSASPIIPIEVGSNAKTYTLSAMLLKAGVYVNPVVHPAVEKDKGILRFSLMATHSKAQIEQAVDIISKVYAQLQKEYVEEEI